MKNIVIDLDGTLLKSDKTISQDAQFVLEQLINSGKRVIIATARPPRGVYGMLPDLLCSLEIIFYNGALIHRNKAVIFEDPIGTDLAVAIKTVLESYKDKIVFGFEQNDWLYTNGSFEHHWAQSLYTETNLGQFSIEKPAKILVDLPDKGTLNYLVANLPSGCRLMVTDKNTLGQIMSKSVSKYTALLVLIPDAEEILHQTICFGDDVNDMDVFRNCTNSVAMENSIEEIKSTARYSTKSNDNDGVSCFLKAHYAVQ